MVPAGASESELALAEAPESAWEEASAPGPEPDLEPESDREREPGLEPEPDLEPERETGSDPGSEQAPETEQAPEREQVQAPGAPAAREAVAPAFHSAPH